VGHNLDHDDRIQNCFLNSLKLETTQPPVEGMNGDLSTLWNHLQLLKIKCLIYSDQTEMLSVIYC
jgi:hypothetical protein